MLKKNFLNAFSILILFFITHQSFAHEYQLLEVYAPNSGMTNSETIDDELSALLIEKGYKVIRESFSFERNKQSLKERIEAQSNLNRKIKIILQKQKCKGTDQNCMDKPFTVSIKEINNGQVIVYAFSRGATFLEAIESLKDSKDLPIPNYYYR